MGDCGKKSSICEFANEKFEWHQLNKKSVIDQVEVCINIWICKLSTTSVEIIQY
jgi:hypothetical protein